MTIPNRRDVTLFELVRLGYREIELGSGIVQDAVEGDKDGCTEFDGLGGVIIGFNGESSTTNPMSLFEYGDVDGYALLFGILL